MDAGEAYLQAWEKKFSGLTAEQIGELKRTLGRLTKAQAEAETSPRVLAAKAEVQKAKAELAESNEQWSEEYCTAIPEDYYEVERLAARAGVPIEWLDEGNWDRMWARIEGYLLSVKDSQPSERKVAPPPNPTPTEDKRDEWIYTECCKGTAYKTIVNRLKKKPETWDRIDTGNGIKLASHRYADRHGLARHPLRQSGRPTK